MSRKCKIKKLIIEDIEFENVNDMCVITLNDKKNTIKMNRLIGYDEDEEDDEYGFVETPYGYYGEDHESRIKEIIETHDEMMKQKKIYKSLNKKLWELLPKDFKYY